MWFTQSDLILAISRDELDRIFFDNNHHTCFLYYGYIRTIRYIYNDRIDLKSTCVSLNYINKLLIVKIYKKN